MNGTAGAVGNANAAERGSFDRQKTNNSRARLPDDDTTAHTISPALATTSPRHTPLIRGTHWLTALSFLALLVTGSEILVSHPRFYWGETGNVNTPALFAIPIPTSRDMIPNGYSYTLPDQNGWSRYLHFESAWVFVLTGLAYFAFGFWRGHFRKNLVPTRSDLTPGNLLPILKQNLRIQKPPEEEAWWYNAPQRVTYSLVIFVLSPLVVWTGLAMSPAVASAFPWVVTFWGGQQSARTVHFLLSVLLALFLFIHVLMVFLSGFRDRMRAMITGRVIARVEER